MQIGTAESRRLQRPDDERSFIARALCRVMMSPTYVHVVTRARCVYGLATSARKIPSLRDYTRAFSRDTRTGGYNHSDARASRRAYTPGASRRVVAKRADDIPASCRAGRSSPRVAQKWESSGMPAGMHGSPLPPCPAGRIIELRTLSVATGGPWRFRGGLPSPSRISFSFLLSFFF